MAQRFVIERSRVRISSSACISPWKLGRSDNRCNTLEFFFAGFAKAAANRLRIRLSRFAASLRHLSSERIIETSQAFKTLAEQKEKTGDATTLPEVVAEYLER